MLSDCLRTTNQGNICIHPVYLQCGPVGTAGIRSGSLWIKLNANSVNNRPLCLVMLEIEKLGEQVSRSNHLACCVVYVLQQGGGEEGEKKTPKRYKKITVIQTSRKVSYVWLISKNLLS